MKKLILLSALFFAMINISNAQLSGQALIDSLEAELPKMKEDTNAVNLLAVLSFEYRTIKPDEGIKYGQQGLKLAKKISHNHGISKCYNSIGVNYISNSDYTKALEFYHKALKINEELDNKTGIAHNLGNIGNIYNFQSDYNKALEYYHKSLKINEELGDKTGIAHNLGNIGTIYRAQSGFHKALEFYHKSLKIYEELGNKVGIAHNLGNIGITYSHLSDYSMALDYYFKALRINQELNRKSGVAHNLGNIGELYFSLSQVSVLSKIKESNEYISLKKEVNLNKSIDYLVQSIEIFDVIGELKRRSEFNKILSDDYSLKGDFKKAYETHVEYKTLQDSVFSLDKAKEFASLETRKEIEVLHAEKKAQQFQSYLLGGGVIVLLGAFVFAYWRFREKKKLSDKLAIQKSEIETQKSLVEEKNEQIYASITYASTIQHAILPWDSTLKNAFSDILIFYKPKDIVSGDSYWFKEVDGVKYLAVIDCTGHGIPGAMLTVIASSVLDDAVLSKRLSNTAEILNEKVTDILNQRLAENETRDGMEVALIAVHQDKIQFSGAGRPLYMKNGTIKIIKTDKRGIAGSAKNDEYNFTSVEINKAENMTLFLTTDGFADQMNEQSKKYSTKRFVELLDSFSNIPTEQQLNALENELSAHRGNREQIDDITILGVKL